MSEDVKEQERVMANFARLIDLATTLNEKPVELLKSAIRFEVLVVAKIPLCDIYLVQRNSIPRPFGHQHSITTKFDDARWLVLTHSNIENICEYGHVDIDEFSTVAYDQNEEGILQKLA